VTLHREYKASIVELPFFLFNNRLQKNAPVQIKACASCQNFSGMTRCQCCSDELYVIVSPRWQRIVAHALMAQTGLDEPPELIYCCVHLQVQPIF